MPSAERARGRRSASSRPAGGRRAPRAAAAARAAARTAATRPRPSPASSAASIDVRLHVRVRADDVVVEADPGHRECQTIRLAARCASRWPRSSRSSARRSGTSRRASRGSRRPRPRAPSCSCCPSARSPATCSTAPRRRCRSPRRSPARRPRRSSASARRLGVHVVCGLLERDGDTLHNAAVLVGPDGLIGTLPQDAPAVPRRRPLRRRRATSCQVFDTPLGRIGLEICYDLRFPEVTRTLALHGRRHRRAPDQLPGRGEDPDAS